ncbi:F-box protein At5g49610-like [Cornus florida]|uniref:F-box protein At5g49610-like n=1 Tax=Cornus florida TaxID=4283 RepID=UPI0028976EBC|nr:F-box protein At5g49610-like [Cornus florida]
MKRLCWFLNDDLTAAVLSRVPTITLLGFKRVWREWRRLISDRSFIQSQLKRMEPIAGLFFQERFHWCNDDIESVSYIPVTTGSEVKQTVLNFLPENVVVLGVSNGLLCCRSCFSSKRPVIYVCNPSNKEWVSLQWPAPDKRNILALVFDPFLDPVDVSTNFKVVRVHKIVTEAEDTDYSTVIEMEDLYFSFGIYSSESGTWRRSMEICQCNHNLLKNKGICIGKVLYWPTDGDKVLMFDVEKELSWLLTVPVPHTLPEICIGESERQLHYVLISEDGLQVWVLEDYLESKWEIKYFIALDKMEEENPEFLCNTQQRVANRGDIPWMDPLAYKDGLLFMRVSTGIFSYHFETREMEELCSLSVLGSNSLLSPILLPYSLSLVPLRRPQESTIPGN